MNLKMENQEELQQRKPINNKYKNQERNKSLEEFIEIERNIDEINLMSPLTWAYVGDCVYELYIRTRINK